MTSVIEQNRFKPVASNNGNRQNRVNYFPQIIFFQHCTVRYYFFESVAVQPPVIGSRMVLSFKATDIVFNCRGHTGVTVVSSLIDFHIGTSISISVFVYRRDLRGFRKTYTMFFCFQLFCEVFQCHVIFCL